MLTYDEAGGMWGQPGTYKYHHVDEPDTWREGISSTPVWVNRKYLTGMGYADEALVELFGEPFAYGEHDIWAFPHVEHIERTVLLPAAKIARAWADEHASSDLLQRYSL
jgi:hypothetical protein